MKELEFELDGYEFIELNKLLKIMNLVRTGGDANTKIDNGEILVNGEVETRKRNKIRKGMIVTCADTTILVK
ncbi:MAG: RNA-binding S4 domain-containing protein [Cytophagales bacterium]